MQRRSLVILVAAAVLVGGGIAAYLAGRGQEPEAAVPTEEEKELEPRAMESLEGQLQNNGEEVSLSLTETELVGMLNDTLEKRGDDRLRNVGIDLLPGRVVATGDVRLAGLPQGRVTAEGTIRADGGKAGIEVERVRLGRLPLPRSVAREVERRLASELDFMDNPAVYWTAVELDDGKVTLRGINRE